MYYIDNVIYYCKMLHTIDKTVCVYTILIMLSTIGNVEYYRKIICVCTILIMLYTIGKCCIL